jgi:hypothetical protein
MGPEATQWGECHWVRTQFAERNARQSELKHGCIVRFNLRLAGRWC